MVGKRSYDDPCGLARALNVVGERWALLVVRELLHGPKRFTDLRAGLPTASQNVLSQRLRELEASGVVRRRRMGPPIGSWVYELTQRGRDLEPALMALARWGSRTPLESAAELSVDALLLAMKTTFDAHAASELVARCELRMDGDVVSAEVDHGRLTIERGSTNGPDAVVEASPATVRSLVFGGVTLEEACRRSDAHVVGDRAVAEHFLALFPRPTVV